jgi:hypothetical protein
VDAARGFDAADLRALIAKRKGRAATMMRGTIHLVTTQDFLAWRMPIQAALDDGARVIVGEQDVARFTPAARKFFDDEPRTFDALRKHLASQFEGNERFMAYAVRMHLPLVLVPDDSAWGWSGSAPFAVAETYLGKKVEEATDARDLALRYLAAFGPATAADFQTWSGLRAAKAVFEDCVRGSSFRRKERAVRPARCAASRRRRARRCASSEYDNSPRSRDRTALSDEHRPRW